MKTSRKDRYAVATCDLAQLPANRVMCPLRAGPEVWEKMNGSRRAASRVAGGLRGRRDRVIAADRSG